MSTINTNGLNVNYPVPGVNNNSQGFRNNFTNIKQNLDIAANELTDLQDSVVLKNPLGNAAINNDMANVLIANASTLGFRATTYNLGGDLIGTVTIDLGIADVHYGTLGGDILLTFGNWAPTGTLSKVTLILSTSNVPNNYTISFPGEVIISSDDFGTTLLNNYETVGVTPTLTFPHGCTELILECYSTDCGDSIYITPVNRPYQSVQIQTRTPPSTGDYGDVVGTVCVDPGTSQLSVAGYINDIFLSSVTITGTGGQFSCAATAVPITPLVVGQPVTISGTFGGTGSIVGYTNPKTYYIIATNGSSTFTLSATPGGTAIVTTPGTPTGLTYTVSADLLFLSNTASLYEGLPIVFTGISTEANVIVGNTYYVRNVVSSTSFTISNNIGGANVGIDASTSGDPLYLNPVQYMYIAVENFNANVFNRSISNITAPNTITVSGSTANLIPNMPIIFTGNAEGNTGNVQVNTVYYVRSVSSSDITISQTRYNGIAGPEVNTLTSVGTGNVDIDYTIYEGSDIFRRIPLQPF